MLIKRVAVLAVLGGMSASAMAQNATITAGDLSTIMADNDRLTQLLKQKNMLLELQQVEAQLNGSGVAPSQANGGQAAASGPAGLPDTDSPQLPMISRLYGSNGDMHADLIYRNGQAVPGVSPGSVLPGGNRVSRVTIDEVVVVGESGEQQRLRFVPRHLSR